MASIPAHPLVKSTAGVAQACEAAVEAKLTHAVIVGPDANGRLVLIDSGGTVAETNFLLDRAKAALFAGDVMSRVAIDGFRRLV